MENQISYDNSKIDELTKEILKLKKATAINIIEIGKKLLLVKEKLPHGEFLKYLEEKVDYTSRTAQKFIKVYEEFGNTKSPSILSTEKLYLLTGLKKENREKFLQENDVENMSTREIKQAIKDIKTAHKKATELLETDNNVITPIEVGTTTKTVPFKEDVSLEGNVEPTDIKSDGAIVVGITSVHSDIWVDTIKMVNEIKLRTGGFYNDINSNLELTDRESLLITRYLNNEITHTQLKQVIEENNLNIPYITSEEIYKKFLDDLDISNSYNHLEENAEGKYVWYYSILEYKDLSWEDVVEFAWEENEAERQGYIKDNKYVFTDENITIAQGYIETTEYIVMYKDKTLFAYFDTDNDYLNDFDRLFSFYHINKKYLKLVEKYIEQKEIDRQEQQKEDYKRAIKNSKFKFIKDNETYLLSEYGEERDYIRVFIDTEEVADYVFDIGMCLYNKDFYNVVIVGDYIDSIRDKIKDKNIKLKYIMDFHRKLKAKAKEIKKEYDPFRDFKGNSDFNWDDFMDDFAEKKDKDIDIFTADEKKLLKKILTNERMAKKLYQMGAMEYHPDMVANKSVEERQAAEENMKLLNAINEKIRG